MRAIVLKSLYAEALKIRPKNRTGRETYKIYGFILCF